MERNAAPGGGHDLRDPGAHLTCADDEDVRESHRATLVGVTSGTPTVLFVCVNNARRGQMAAALLERRTRGRVDVRSAGSDPAEQINPSVVEEMGELGVDLARSTPKRITDDAVRAADVVVTMGCGDACPVYPSKRYEDWQLDDPAGKDVKAVRQIRDEIARRVDRLAAELVPETD